VWEVGGGGCGSVSFGGTVPNISKNPSEFNIKLPS
jgi:hypothetical protein